MFDTPRKALKLLFFIAIYQVTLPLYARFLFRFGLVTEILPHRNDVLGNLSEFQSQSCENFYLANASKLWFKAGPCVDVCNQAVELVRRRWNFTDQTRDLSYSVRIVSEWISPTTLSNESSTVASIFEKKSCVKAVRDVSHTNRGLEVCLVLVLFLLFYAASECFGRVVCHQICYTLIAAVVIDASPALVLFGGVVIVIVPELRFVLERYNACVEAVGEFLTSFFRPEKRTLMTCVMAVLAVALMVSIEVLEGALTFIQTIMSLKSWIEGAPDSTWADGLVVLVSVCEGARQTWETLEAVESHGVTQEEQTQCIRVSFRARKLNVQYFDNGSVTWRCDGKSKLCSRKSRGPRERWSCRELNYDLCRGCMEEVKEAVTTPIAQITTKDVTSRASKRAGSLLESSGGKRSKRNP